MPIACCQAGTGPELYPCGADRHTYPLFLSKDWFEPSTAFELRRKLRHDILELFVKQAADKDTPACVRAASELVHYGEEPPAAKCATFFYFKMWKSMYQSRQCGILVLLY